MIRYALICDRRHSYESWFRDAAAYDDQVARHLLSCPVCGSLAVEKAVMAPQIARKDRHSQVEVTQAEPIQPEPTQSMALLPAEARELRLKLKALRAQLTANSENVGKRFAEEARRIHFGEVENRPIHGEASLHDAKALMEEGVEVLPIPIMPEDWN